MWKLIICYLIVYSLLYEDSAVLIVLGEEQISMTSWPSWMIIMAGFLLTLTVGADLWWPVNADELHAED